MSAILTCPIEWMRWNDEPHVHGRIRWYAGIYSHGWDKGKFMIGSFRIFALLAKCYSFIHFVLFQSRFTNPVYESMYADSSEPVVGIVGIGGSNNIESISSSVLEEKTGLLQRDEIQLNDLLWQLNERY